MNGIIELRALISLSELTDLRNEITRPRECLSFAPPFLRKLAGPRGTGFGFRFDGIYGF
jgi:hypothetical protein